MFYLQLRNELWKLFPRKRSYIGFLMFLLAQNVIILLFRFTNGPRVSMIRTLEGNGYLAQQFISALTVATFMLLPIAYLLLPLYVSLVGGDLVAKEAEDGTLRMILSRPVSRLRSPATSTPVGRTRRLRARRTDRSRVVQPDRTGLQARRGPVC